MNYSTQDSTAIAKNAVQHELTAKANYNPAYGLLYNQCAVNNWSSAVYDALVHTVGIYCKIQADAYGLSLQDAIKANVGKLCASKAATVFAQSVPCLESQPADLLSWIQARLTAANLITQEVNAADPSILRPAEATTGTSADTQPVRGRIRRIPVQGDGSVDNLEPVKSEVIPEQPTPTHRADGSYIPRPIKRPLRSSANPSISETGERKTRAISSNADRMFAANAKPAPAPIAQPTRTVPDALTMPSRTTSRISQIDAKTDSPVEANKRGTTMPEIVNTAQFSENKMDYNNHQLYRVFGDGSSNRRKTDFMGALAEVEITDAKEFSRRKELGDDPKTSVVWSDKIYSAACGDEAISRIGSRLLGSEFVAGRDGSIAFNFDHYHQAKLFEDKSTLALFREESPLRNIFAEDLSESPTLREVHTALALALADQGTTPLITSLNARITNQFNTLLQHELLSDLLIDSFIEDFDEVLAILGETLTPHQLAIIEGNPLDVDDRPDYNLSECPGRYLPVTAARLVNVTDPDKAKELNGYMTDTRKQIAERSLFFVSRHCICYVGGCFEDLPITAIPELWSIMKGKEMPFIDNLYKQLESQQDDPRFIVTYHLVFADGYEVELKPTNRGLLGDGSEGSVYLARIRDKNNI